MEESIEELEARMYAQVYHDNNVEQTAETSDYLPPNLNRQSNKRYWQKSKNLSTQNFFDPHTILVNHNSFNSSNDQQTLPKIPSLTKTVQPQVTEEPTSTPVAIKTFVPYSSVLSFMAAPAEVPKENDKINNFEKKKSKAAKAQKAGKLLNPMSKQGKGKSAMKIEVQAKKQKATMSRKKAQGRVITTIELVDSDESDCIPVEVPPPPLITLDSSDEEMIKKNRALSPSTSSIISDDFIVAGDKRRLVNPFTSEEAVNKLRRIAQLKETLEKVKALTKVSSSTSSSDSARSSCERNLSKEKKSRGVASSEQKQVSSIENRSKRKSAVPSIDTSTEDSIYGMKLTKTVKQTKVLPSDSSEEEVPCVNAKNQKPRRRKSISSRKKSTDSEVEEDPRLKLIASSTPVEPKGKRSRFITPSYNDDEFASMISTILRSNDVLEDESTDGDDDESEISKSKAEAVKTNETVVSIPDSTIRQLSLVEKEPPEVDCEIIEQPIAVFEVPDEDPIMSDSDDSMRDVKLPPNCDLSLNVTQVPYDPHEYIRNAGNSSSSREVSSTTSDTLINPEIGWNDEMKFFYDGSWGDETFCISQILNAMPRDQKLWRVINADRVRTQDSGARIRCRKCNEIGHIATKCNKPKKRVVCFMCGEEGHRETRCPNSICLRCGKPNRLFATICTACHKLSKKSCPLCNYQGHDIEQCPDKWRRYHSTTSDSNELNSGYKVNERVYCSICARRGHFAENCNQFFKTISGMITSSVIRITSHKPSYPRIYLNSFDQIKGVAQDHQQLLALFTYFPFYRFNFKFPRNVRLYPRFMEQFMLHQKRKEANAAIVSARPAICSTPKDKKSKKKRKRSDKNQDETSVVLQISLSSDGNRTVTSSESQAVVEHHDDSNSNYSFTEFYNPALQSTSGEVFKSPGDVNETSFDKTSRDENVMGLTDSPESPKLVKNPFAVKMIPLADFIPLSRDEAPQHVRIEREPEVSCEARMLLTKEHFLMLTNEKGQNFLFDLQNRLCIASEFKWDSTGNSLMITGMPSNQSMFHLEVREYLYRIQLDHHEKIMAISSQLPKNKASIVSYLKLNLQSLNKIKAFQTKKNLELMINAERSMDHKKALKLRKTLNIAFIGHAELGDGGQHVGALRRILYKLEKELGQGKIEISVELREEIMQHMKPIFSTMNHGDYQELFSQYAKVVKQRKKKNMLWNPMILN